MAVVQEKMGWMQWISALLGTPVTTQSEVSRYVRQWFVIDMNCVTLLAVLPPGVEDLKFVVKLNVN